MRVLRTFIILIVMAAALVVFASAFASSFLYAPDDEIEAPPEQMVELPGPEEVPVRLRIPALGVNALVQHVGITESGAMATPKGFQDAGWYKYGVTPGGSGSAVIAGHVDNGLGLAGVFSRLHELREGDEIFVVRADGSDVRFLVSGKRSYPHDAAPTDIIFNPAGSPRLNLITCEGTWLSDTRTYDQRLVVFTTLASD